MKFTVGADPELFILDTQSKYTACAHNMVPGTKWEPHAVNKGAIQVDGTALEFNIDPASSADEFVSNIESVMGSLRKYLDSQYEFRIIPSVVFHAKNWKKFPDEAKVLGCDPDYNAYTGQLNIIPEGTEASNIRGAGGHIHIGWRDDNVDPLDPVHFAECQMVAKHLDKRLGLPSIMFESVEGGQRRRKANIGVAGAFRPKPYGIEYRTLSNFWIKNPKYMRGVYENVMTAMNEITDPRRSSVNQSSNIARIINSNDRNSAERWLLHSTRDMRKSYEAFR